MRVVILTTLILIFITGCQRESPQTGSEKKDKPPPADEGEKFAKTVYGENVSILLRGDMNSNGKPDLLAVVINKQLDEMKFWTQRGGVIENTEDGWKTILRVDNKVSSTKGDLKEIPDSRTGYIISFKMEQNPIFLNILVSDLRGNPISGEYGLKWNELEYAYELAKSQK